MQETNEQAHKITGPLKFLTILSIIGSSLQLLSTGYGYFFAEKNYEMAKKLMDSGELTKLPSFFRDLYTPEYLQMLEITWQQRVPLLIIGLLASGLCLVGAIQMRKLKKQGYILWLSGEVLIPVAHFVYFGSSSVQGLNILSPIFVLIFVIAYTLYRKELTN